MPGIRGAANRVGGTSGRLDRIHCRKLPEAFFHTLLQAQNLLLLATMASQRFQTAVLLVLAGIAALFFGPFLVPIAAGLVFAAILAPLQTKLEKRGWKPKAAAAVLTLMFLFIVMVPAGTLFGLGANRLVESIEQSSSQRTAQIQESAQPEGISKRIVEWAPVNSFLDRMNVREADLQAWIARNLHLAQERIGKAFAAMLSQLPGALFSGIISIGTLFFMLSERARAWNFCLRFLPVSHSFASDLVRSFVLVSRSVLLGYVVSGACQATVLMTGTLVAGKGPTLLIGLTTFLLAFVPVLGTAPISMGLVLWQAFQGDFGTMAIFMIFGLLTGTVDNLVVPWFVGKETEIHPLLVFISAFGALPFAGPFGLFLGPIFTFLFIHALSMRAARPAETTPSIRRAS